MTTREEMKLRRESGISDHEARKLTKKAREQGLLPTRAIPVRTTAIGITALNRAINEIDQLCDRVKRTDDFRFKFYYDISKPPFVFTASGATALAIRMWVAQELRPLVDEMMHARQHRGPKA